jgi:hypothetical protein
MHGNTKPGKSARAARGARAVRRARARFNRAARRRARASPLPARAVLARSPRDAEALDLLEELLRLAARKVLADRLEHLVDRVREVVFEVARVDLAPDLVGGEGGVGILDDRAAALGRALEGPRRLLAEDDVLDPVHAGVLLLLRGRAEGAADLALDVFGRVLHEDGRVRVRLGHLLLALLEAHEHRCGGRGGEPKGGGRRVRV